jgi:hypothetical protein
VECLLAEHTFYLQEEKEDIDIELNENYSFYQIKS